MKQFKFTIDGHNYATTVNEISDGLAEVTVNGTTFKVEIEKEEPKKAAPRNTIAQTTRVINSAQQSAGTQSVKSPLPGSIVKVNVKVGDKVAVGDELLTMESMKMENSIDSDRDGMADGWELYVMAGPSGAASPPSMTCPSSSPP